MHPLTAARVHVLEHPILGPFRALTTGILVGPLLYLYGGETDFPTIFGLDMSAVLFFAAGHVLHHSHVWVYYGPIIGRVFVSPAQHQIHHSCLPRHLDKNFAEHWAVWDWLFGTLYLPRGRETLKLGLAGYVTQPHSGLVSANLRPLVESTTAFAALARRLYGKTAPAGRLYRKVALAWRRHGKTGETSASNVSFPAILGAEHTPDPG